MRLGTRENQHQNTLLIDIRDAVMKYSRDALAIYARSENAEGQSSMKVCRWIIHGRLVVAELNNAHSDSLRCSSVLDLHSHAGYRTLTAS